jgi:hypothetical protein
MNCGLIGFSGLKECWRPMGKTHFEQVPVEVIEGILEENSRRERIQTGRETPETKKKDRETDILETMTPNAWSERV